MHVPRRPIRPSFLLCCVWGWLSCMGRVQAEDATTGKAAPALAIDTQLRIDPGILPALAAIGPGFLLHGSGAFVAGDRPAARRLLLLEAAGISAILSAGAVVASTGTSRRLIGTFTPIIVLGGGMFFLSWIADIYAATTGGRDVHAAPFVSPVEWELGYRYVHDPQFDYRNFSYARADFRVSRFRASPSAWVALDDNNQRLALELAGRALGNRTSRPSADGSYLDGVSALTYANYRTESFAVWTGELRLDGRLDLAHMGQSLRGAFVEGHIGAGLELYDFEAPGARVADDASGLLLARFGFGVYYGDSRARTGEAFVYYDHRHDDYAAGLGVTGIGGGILGHLGATAHYFVTRRWALSLLFEVGSAYVAGAGLRYRLVRRGKEMG
jgi:hypothetical protein